MAGVVLSTRERQAGEVRTTAPLRWLPMSDTIQEVGREKPDWLAALEHDPADGPRVHRVGELLPPGYAVYLRLFHPFLPWGVDPYSADESQRRTWKSLAVEAGATSVAS